MPCTISKWEEEQYQKEERDRHIRVSQMFCSVMQLVEQDLEMLEACSKGVLAWWEEHKEHDKERIERELKEQERQELKAEALAKLSPYERSLLGIR